jgi:hypothetical protein
MVDLKGLIIGVVAGFAFALVGVYAYNILTINGTATGVEGIEADKLVFTAQLYPNETVVETITFTNLGSEAIDIDLSDVVTGPNPSTITVDLPAKLTILGGGTKTADVEMVAKNNLEPGEYNIQILVTR